MHIEDGIANAGQEFEADPANIKPDGTAAVGVLETVARADHVHPLSEPINVMRSGIIPLGTKLITVVAPGTYRLREFDEYSDAPQEEAISHGNMLVLCTPNSDTGTQIIYSYSNPHITWQRSWSGYGASVSSWTKCGYFTDWISLTLASEWSGTVAYKQVGKTVMVRGNNVCKSVAADRWDVIGILPAAISPSMHFRIGAAVTEQAGTSAMYELYFNTTGQIHTFPTSLPANTSIGFTTTYLI